MPRPPLEVGTYGKMRLTEKGPNKWVATAQFRDTDGITRPVTATAKTSAAAERALKSKLKDRAAPEGELITRTTRLDDLAEFLFAELKGQDSILPQTIDNYRRDWEKDASPKLGQLRIHEATVGRIDKFLKELQDAGYKSKPKKCKAVMSQMFDLAVRHQACAFNPTKSVARLKKQKKEIVTIDLALLGEVRAAVRTWMTAERPGPKDHDLADTIDTLLGTGARIGEVLALRWDDIDLAATAPTVTIAGTMAYVKGKGYFRQNWTKTNAGYRTIFMPKFLVDVMMKRMVNQPANNPQGAVFPTRKGTFKTPPNVRRQWRAARADTGFEFVTPHTFRKTVATLIKKEAEGGMTAAAGVLGHSSEEVTKTYYVADPKLAPDVSEVMHEHLAPHAQVGPEQ